MTVPVIDPLGVGTDPGMRFLGQALDPADAEPRLESLLGRGRLRLLAIRAVRHKPGRRCIVEYDVEIESRDFSMEAFTLLGKARARRPPDENDQILRLLRARGFGSDAEDGIGVPEPFGVIPEYRMSLERKVPGLPASQLFGRAGGVDLARTIAEAACKLHRTGVLPRRCHTMADELAILREKLGELAATRPELVSRLSRVLQKCERLAARVPTPTPRGIHRDFYADQVIANGPRLFLVDFDLFCQGDPAVDAGNFLGHLTEQALRLSGDPAALSECERAFEDRFVELSGSPIRPAVRTYAALTIVRHVYLSTRFEERRPFTETLLELAEERLGTTARIPARASVS